MTVARTTGCRPTPSVVGRVGERTAIRELVAGIRTVGGALVVRGEPGIGKTCLLEDAAATAPEGTRVVRLDGTESEVLLPFAALADLLRDLAGAVDGLDDGLRTVLRGVLALDPGAPSHLMAVCTAALETLAAAGKRELLLVVVDDVQWIDRPSRRVLAFVGRRLRTASVVLLIAARDRPELPELAALPGLRLGGMTVAECSSMLAGRGTPTPAGTVAAAVEQCAGNPLAVIETLAPTRSPAGPSTSVAAVWDTEIDGLPDATRRSLLVVAAARGPELAPIESVLHACGLTLGDLEPAERRNLVRADAAGLMLRHPLLRSAIVNRTPIENRLATYREFAAASEGHERAWYLAAAATGPDDRVASMLAEAALEVRRRNGVAAASRVWYRAAELTADTAARSVRLREAAADAHAAGESESAIRWCNEALAVPGIDDRMAADARRLRGRALAWLGRPRQAFLDLVQVAGTVAVTDPALTARIYAEAGSACAMDAAVTDMRRVAALCVDLGIPDSLPALATTVPAAVFAGETTEARRMLESVPAAADTSLPDLPYALSLGLTRVRIEQFDRARAVIGSVLEASRQAGAAATLPVAAGARAELDWWTGFWASAYADASESLDRAAELGQVGVIASALSILARFDAARGDFAAARERIDLAYAEAGPYQIGSTALYLPAAAGVAAMTGGDTESAAEVLETTWRSAREAGLGDVNTVPFVPDLIEAHVRIGNRDRAEELLAWLEDRATRSALVFPVTTAARLRGMLASDPDVAEGHFIAAHRAQERCPMPFEHARTLLCRAESLRRARRPAAARPVLREAHALFRSLGARPWTERTERELAASGARLDAGAGSPAWTEALTPQEFQVTRAIAEGRSNAEVAAMLFVSAKTVEAHLTRVYRKLAVRSRTELARRFNEL